MEDVFSSIDNDSMAGIASALIADYHSGLSAKEIYDLSLPLITPGCSDNNNIFHLIYLLD